MCTDTFSQSLSLFDVNGSNFPTMRGKFYAFDTQGQQIRPSVGDLAITENGVSRTITSVSCPPGVPSPALSSVLVIDVSGSMDWGIQDKNITLAKAAATAWVNGLPLGTSECAITTFDHANYMNQDFTTNRQKLLTAISQLQPQGGTDYDAALINQMSGGLLVSKKGKHKKILILLTDGQASTPKTQQIIQEANQQNCTIYCVTLGMFAPQSLKDIASQTGGETFENVTTVKEAEDVYKRILQVLQGGGEPCSIEWQSGISCDSSSSTLVKLRFITQNLSAQAIYQAPATALARLEFSPLTLRFDSPVIGSGVKKTLKITARNSAFAVSTISSSNPAFTITPTSFTLQPNQSQNITITYIAVDSSGFVFSKLSVINDVCEQNYFVSGGYKGKKPTQQTLKLTFPNGGETFVVGSDSIIRWEGIPSTELVRLEYSTNTGTSWIDIDIARGLSYTWQKIPRPASTQCLVRILQLPSDSSSVRTLSGHIDVVSSVAYSPDGSTLASGSADKTIKLWDIATGQELHTLTGHTNWVNSVAYSPDGSTLASGSIDPTIKFWDIATVQELRTLKGHTDWVYSVAYSSDGKILASGSDDNTIKLWNAATGQEFRTLTGHKGYVRSVAYSPDGKTLASGSWDNTIKLWNVATGQELRTLTGHTNNVLNVAFSPDRRTLASGSDDRTIKLWNVATGQELRTLKGHTGYVRSVAYSPDGKTLASGSGDSTIKLWDIATGQELRTLTGHTGRVYSVAYSPDGKSLASGGYDKTIKLWDIDMPALQSDQSDRVFSIVEPLPISQDIAMGQVILGTRKDSVVTDVVRNTGTWRFDVDRIYFRGADASAFALIAGSPPYMVEANRSHFGEFRFTPTRVGLHTADIVIITQSDTLVQKITGTGVQQSIEVIGKLIDFGAVGVGDTKDTLQSITIRNRGSVPVTIIGTTHGLPNGIDFTTLAGGGSFTLRPNETRLMDLRFSAREIGRTSGTLKFTYNGAGSPAIVQLFGEGIAASIQGSITTFADVLCDTIGNADITIANTGVADLVIDSIRIVGNNGSEFTLPPLTPLSIASNSNKRLPITFRPQSVGIKTAIVEFFSNAEQDSVFVIPITARKDEVKLQANNIDIGLICPNEQINASMVIRNTGSIDSKATFRADAGVQLSKDSVIVPTGSNAIISVDIAGIAQEGAFSKTIRITDRCGVESMVTVTGIVETPQLQASDVTLTTILGSSINQRISITNSSTRAVTISGISGIVSPFKLIGNPLPLTIAPQGIAEIEVQYLPVDTNQVVDTMELKGSPCDVVRNIRLTGNAISAGLTVQVPNTEGYPGDEIEIPIILKDARNVVQAGVNSLDGTLSFNPSILYPKGYAITAINDTLASINVMNISINNPAGTPAVRIPFVAMLGNAEECVVRLEQVIPQGGSATITKFNGNFTLLGLCREGGTRLIHDNTLTYLLKVMPNPSDGEVEIAVSVIEVGVSTLKIYNANGTMMEEHHFTTLGNKKVTIDTKAYGNGLYFIMLHTPSTLDTAKLLMVK